MTTDTETGLVTEIKTITPAMAKEWLAAGKNLRKPNTIHVNRLATEIAKGRFRLNGESIKFDSRNRLVDGQHRLHAVILADKAIESVVIYGVQDALDVDTGRPRRLHEVMASMGHTDAAAKAAAVRCLYWLTKGDDPWASTSFKESAPTLMDLVTCLRRLDRERLDRCSHLAMSLRPQLRVPPSPIIAACYMMLGVSESITEKLMGQLASGEGIKSGDPAFALRRLFLQAARSRWASREGIRSVYGVTIKAFNAMVDGIKVGNLMLRPEELLPVPGGEK